MVAPRPRQGRITLSSLPLQILLYLNGWYYVFWWICEILLFVYKGSILLYPPHALGAEIFLLFVFAAVEKCRTFLGSKGNLTENSSPLSVSIAFGVPVIFAYLFYLLWQTYVLRIEAILQYIGIAFTGLEMLISVYTVIVFARNSQF
eukprot:Colp12_sorted_trinity150504_noHs@13357